jgi:hypothetical protein
VSTSSISSGEGLIAAIDAVMTIVIAAVFTLGVGSTHRDRPPPPVAP